MTIEKVNEFNRDNRFARVYLDKEKQAVIESDVIFTDRLMTEKMLEENLDVFESTMTKFAKFIRQE
ncbi:MAG TPA: YbjN domain-containing protein [Sphingomicrobium sp.]